MSMWDLLKEKVPASGSLKMRRNESWKPTEIPTLVGRSLLVATPQGYDFWAIKPIHIYRDGDHITFNIACEDSGADCRQVSHIWDACQGKPTPILVEQDGWFRFVERDPAYPNLQYVRIDNDGDITKPFNTGTRILAYRETGD